MLGLIAPGTLVGPGHVSPGWCIRPSAGKRSDAAGKSTVKSVQDDAFQGGTDSIFDAKTDGVGLGKISAAGQEFSAQIDAVKTKIAAGGITIPSEVK